MATFLGKLGICGFAKENPSGTAQIPPTVFLPFLPPESFTAAIAQLESKGVYNHISAAQRMVQGAGEIKGAKIKVEMNPETIGHMLMAAFGADVVTETASFTVTLNSNDRIDFTVDAGGAVSCQIAAGTYAMGTASSQAGTLCQLIKAGMEAASAGRTFTVTYSATTKKMTIAVDAAHVFVMQFLSGTNNAKTICALIGFTKADTASALTATSNSTTLAPVQTHTFKRVDALALPTYTYWFKKADKYPYFSGCMLSKLIIEAKAKEYITADAEFVGLKYEGYDAGGGSVSPAYSTRVPYTFANAQVKIDTVASLDYDSIKIELDNAVAADHVLQQSIWAGRIYSTDFRATIAANLIFSDDTQYQKFLNDQTAKIELIFSHPDKINGVTPYGCSFTVPLAKYLGAPLTLPEGKIIVPFSAVAKYSDSDSANIIATMNTDVATAY